MIRLLEEQMLNAWPSLQQHIFDGWVLRFAHGYTRRANSVNFLYDGEQEVHQKIQHCVDTYRRNNLPPVFRITPLAHPANIDTLLADLGFSRQSPTSVQSLDLETLTAQEVAGFEFSPEFSPNWLNKFERLQGVEHNTTHQAILQNIVSATCYATLSSDDQIVACGLAILEGQTVGLYDIITAADQRRKGFGHAMILNILHWAKQCGATHAFLSVEKANDPALKLYAKLGFTEIYQYWYRVLE
jgi:ribosomal protein S18 acetylase RimI-like enzyme